MYQEFYKDGKLEGERKEWHVNGSLEKRGFYRDGKLEGEQKEWFANEHISLSLFYRDGKLEGKAVNWYSNGFPFELLFYRNDRPEGDYRSFNEDGSLEAHYYLRNGEVVDDEFTWKRKNVFLRLQKLFFRRIFSRINSFIIRDLFALI